MLDCPTALRQLGLRVHVVDSSQRSQTGVEDLEFYGTTVPAGDVLVLLAGSANPEDITKALHGLNGYAPVTGTMTWDERGEQRYGAVGVYELRRGSWDLRMRSDRW